jgi:hypothetical protein
MTVEGIFAFIFNMMRKINVILRKQVWFPNSPGNFPPPLMIPEVRFPTPPGLRLFAGYARRWRRSKFVPRYLRALRPAERAEDEMRDTAVLLAPKWAH